ncbi:GNAT family N-acetyltransferase [Paenibacillus sp. N3/727]|uniref:GNAT family N-acetyltransferase n=1 Tax=Paenibacillus sp. N3/727 TaxID=2925845 RepID=UPI001F52E308|nr:GNAT family N-acetyltransferase [Paenibacillus sp. N3/727]UNK20966.1 GNAT family N-acetyltransferase [Paenibacillus sp. N3/727]
MDYKLYLAAKDEKDIFANLMQYYFYDFSEFIDIDVEGDGQFDYYPHLDSYWSETAIRFPYLLKINGKYAGFALVRQIQTEEKTYFSMAEFFIMKKYRRSGVGKQVAKELFDLHPGAWEVFQLATNIPAQRFWTKVISEYTKSEYQEHDDNGKKTQKFISGEVGYVY